MVSERVYKQKKSSCPNLKRHGKFPLIPMPMFSQAAAITLNFRLPVIMRLMIYLFNWKLDKWLFASRNESNRGVKWWNTTTTATRSHITVAPLTFWNSKPAKCLGIPCVKNSGQMAPRTPPKASVSHAPHTHTECTHICRPIKNTFVRTVHGIGLSYSFTCVPSVPCISLLHAFFSSSIVVFVLVCHQHTTQN